MLNFLSLKYLKSIINIIIIMIIINVQTNAKQYKYALISTVFDPSKGVCDAHLGFVGVNIPKLKYES